MTCPFFLLVWILELVSEVLKIMFMFCFVFVCVCNMPVRIVPILVIKVTRNFFFFSLCL